MSMYAALRPAPEGRRARALALSALALAALAGCYQEPSRWDQAQQETRRNVRSVAKEALPGSSFNKMFPKKEGDYDLVPTQEKAGFAEYTLVKKGQDVATLAVFDTASSPDTADKYRGSDLTLGGYPTAEIGTAGTGVLVANRFQVQVRSKDANFTKDERAEWIKKFDLANLAKLQ